jgi:flagellar protein FliJ
MKNTFRLKVVQDLAQKQSDDAALKLGTLNAEVSKAQAKLDMLIGYREEYRERLRNSVHQDVQSIGWKNLHQFLDKLEEAIEQQRAAVSMCQQAVHGGQREWQSKQTQVKAYDMLEQRHELVQAERLKRLDQRVMDEFAARGHAAKA